LGKKVQDLSSFKRSKRQAGEKKSKKGSAVKEKFGGLKKRGWPLGSSHIDMLEKKKEVRNFIAKLIFSPSGEKQKEGATRYRKSLTAFLEESQVKKQTVNSLCA